MPVKPSPPSLKRLCMETISSQYQLICYGCTSRTQMNQLLNADEDEGGYLDIPGPFTDLPSSLLEELVQVIYDHKGLPNETLHQLILPQLESYKIQMRSSRHIQTNLIGQRCEKLKSLDFAYSKSIQPMFYTKFFRNFPNLVRINLQGTIIDNEGFDSIGEICTQLKEINISHSTITDAGLMYLCVNEEDDLKRCQQLLSISIEKTRTSAKSVAYLLYYHPLLVKLGYENFAPVFEYFHSPEFIKTTKISNYRPTLRLRNLMFAEDKVSEEGFTAAIESCPLLESVVVHQTDLSNSLLGDLMSISSITSLHLGNSSFSRHTLHFEDGIIPLLLALGQRLTSLNLEKFNKVDVMQIGDLCPHLTYLRLSCVGSYVPVFDLLKVQFSELEELELLNTRGAHVFTKTIHQIMNKAKKLKHAKFQFVDTLNDEVWSDILCENPLEELQTIVFDQCHSISVYTLEGIVAQLVSFHWGRGSNAVGRY
eukprot:GFUD01055542.1.p1 GENE.GFUD01055542.1~~GFUD01055542.1.p1  ORF type:complete len:481 (+),score=77.20 GFUD01055542.1:123-1565(+)